MELDNDAEFNIKSPCNNSEITSRPSEKAKKSVEKARQFNKANMIGNRRFGEDYNQQMKDSDSFEEILTCLQSSKFLNKSLLIKLKCLLGSGVENPEEFFLSGCGDQNLYNLVNIMSNNGHESQLLAVEVLANLSPLGEKNGLKVSRAAGPYLISLLSSSSNSLKEASSIALGNLALSGFKVVKVLLHQDVLDRLSINLPDSSNDYQTNVESQSESDKANFSKVTSATLYALYHIIHSLDCAQLSNTGSSRIVPNDTFEKLLERCCKLLHAMKSKAPLELFWVLFAMSCRVETHCILANECIINNLLDVCTYEIYQKSDPRPLVKVVTPICRTIANLCGGSNSGEAACLFVLRHPDVTALLMALLGTNYTHLCKETLWLFANIVNSESVLVQEEIVELNILDKLEYHTTAVVQKLDPYAVRPGAKMTKLFALLVLYKGENSAHILKAAYDLASFGYFQRSSIQEFISFTSKILTERTTIGERQSVKEGEYMCHAYVRSDSLVGLCVSDHEYPNRVAHTLLTKILEDFTAQVPRSQWPEGKEVAGFSGPLDVHLKKFQNPAEADPMMKVQTELDETKIILHNTIEAVLSRGEKLDDLVDKSEGLSLQSKTFYKTARKTNSCCGSWT